MQTDESTRSIEQPLERATAEVAQALSRGPIGALVIASIAVGLLFIAWLLFYFLLFMPRGSIG